MGTIRKEYQLALGLVASLDPNFKKNFKSAGDSIGTLKEKLDAVKKTQKDISGYQDMQKSIDKTKDKIKELGEKHVDLQAKLAKTVQDEAKIKKALDGLGAAAGMAATRIDNLKGDTELAEGAWQEFAMTIGDIFTPNARETVKYISDIIKKLTDFVKKNPDTIKNIAKIATTLIGIKAAGQVGKLGFSLVKGGINDAQAAFKIFSGGVRAIGTEGPESLGLTLYITYQNSERTARRRLKKTPKKRLKRI